MSELVFEPFRKIPRLNRDIVITEKIDGTNGCVIFNEKHELIVGSRNREITPEKDNFGFARWCHEHRDELFLILGVGRFYGEWWGPGIQRGYGQAQKRFSLFNPELASRIGEAQVLHGVDDFGLGVVPKLYEGPWFALDSQRYGLGWAPNLVLRKLKDSGSQASPGFMRPEGIVVYHTASGASFKVTVENDEKPKGDAR